MENGVSLNFLLRFTENNDIFADLTTTAVVERIIKPQTAGFLFGGSSYVDYLQSRFPNDVKKANVFISHAWGGRFLDLVETIKNHFTRRNEERQDDIFLWLDIFSINQHNPPSTFEQWKNSFIHLIDDINRTVLVLTSWNNPFAFPLRRGWCLLEIYCTAKNKSKSEVKLEIALGKKFFENSAGPQYAFYNLLTATFNLIKLEYSKCSHRSDEKRIRRLIGGKKQFQAANLLINSIFSKAVQVNLANNQHIVSYVREINQQVNRRLEENSVVDLVAANSNPTIYLTLVKSFLRSKNSFLYNFDYINVDFIKHLRNLFGDDFLLVNEFMYHYTVYEILQWNKPVDREILSYCISYYDQKLKSNYILTENDERAVLFIIKYFYEKKLLTKANEMVLLCECLFQKNACSNVFYIDLGKLLSQQNTDDLKSSYSYLQKIWFIGIREGDYELAQALFKLDKTAVVPLHNVACQVAENWSTDSNEFEKEFDELIQLIQKSEMKVVSFVSADVLKDIISSSINFRIPFSNRIIPTIYMAQLLFCDKFSSRFGIDMCDNRYINAIAVTAISFLTINEFLYKYCTAEQDYTYLLNPRTSSFFRYFYSSMLYPLLASGLFKLITSLLPPSVIINVIILILVFTLSPWLNGFIVDKILGISETSNSSVTLGPVALYMMFRCLKHVVFSFINQTPITCFSWNRSGPLCLYYFVYSIRLLRAGNLMVAFLMYDRVLHGWVGKFSDTMFILSVLYWIVGFGLPETDEVLFDWLRIQPVIVQQTLPIALNVFSWTMLCLSSFMYLESKYGDLGLNIVIIFLDCVPDLLYFLFEVHCQQSAPMLLVLSSMTCRALQNIYGSIFAGIVLFYVVHRKPLVTSPLKFWKGIIRILLYFVSGNITFLFFFIKIVFFDPFYENLQKKMIAFRKFKSEIKKHL